MELFSLFKRRFSFLHAWTDSCVPLFGVGVLRNGLPSRRRLHVVGVPPHAHTEEGGRCRRRAQAAEPEEGGQAPGGRRPRELRHFSVKKPFVIQLGLQR